MSNILSITGKTSTKHENNRTNSHLSLTNASCWCNLMQIHDWSLKMFNVHFAWIQTYFFLKQKHFDKAGFNGYFIKMNMCILPGEKDILQTLYLIMIHCRSSS